VVGTSAETGLLQHINLKEVWGCLASGANGLAEMILQISYGVLRRLAMTWDGLHPDFVLRRGAQLIRKKV
jgi:hypothetical protein